MKKILLFVLTLFNMNVYSQRPVSSSEIEQRIETNSVIFFDSKHFNNADEVQAAAASPKKMYKTLRQGEKFRVLAVEGHNLQLTKIELSKGKIGWIPSKNVPNRYAFLPLLSFRDIYIPNIESHSVAPMMTREEVFVVSNVYLGPHATAYESLGDYITYNFNDGKFKFYKNSLFFASANKGAFWYKNKIIGKLTEVSRNDSILTNLLADNHPNYFCDENLSIIWSLGNKELDFVIKNKAQSSIKILWDDMVFVKIGGGSQRIIHKGVKFSEKNNSQPASVVGKNADYSDLLIPSENVYYSTLNKQWQAYPILLHNMYSPEDNQSNNLHGIKVQVLFPVMINEKRIEYNFIFKLDHIEYELKNGRYIDAIEDAI